MARATSSGVAATDETTPNKANTMQAIITKYIGPTNFRGSRISARASAGRITVPYQDDSQGTDGAHAYAVAAFCRKLGWFGELVSGGMPDGTGNCYVFVSRAKDDAKTLRIDGRDF